MPHPHTPTQQRTVPYIVYGDHALYLANPLPCGGRLYDVVDVATHRGRERVPKLSSWCHKK